MGKPTWLLDDKRLERLINHDWRTTIRDGEVEAAESLRKGTRMNGRHIAWALLREAIKVARIAYAAPPRSGYPKKSALPDGVDEVTVWQMVSSYLRGELENLPEPDTKAPRPSAKQISRAEVILELWHNAALAGKGDKKRLKKAVYAKAAGRKPRHIHAATGLSYKQLWKAQEEASNDLWEIILRFSKKKVLIKRETILRLSTRLGRLHPDLLFSKGFVETNSVFRVRCLAACGAAYSPFFASHANDLPHSSPASPSGGAFSLSTS